MANALYGKGRGRFAEAQISWSSDTIKTCLIVTSIYSVSIDAHEFWSDVASSSYSGITPITLTSKTSSLGVLDAADITFSAVSGSTIGALIMYKDTGSSASSPLLLYIDTATGLPITPNGGDIIVQFDSGPNRICKL
jgi:hypothetical protein